MARFSGVAPYSFAIVFLIPASLFANVVSLDQAIEIAVENNPNLAAVANELTIAQSEIERANYITQFNPE